MGVGDLATWVGSIGIVATLAVTGRQLERERRLRRREEHRSQAIEISAWPGGADLQPVGPVQLPNGTLIMVANHSHQPIYEVVVTLVSVQGAGPQAGGDWVAEAEPGSGRLPLGAAFVAVGPGNWTVTVSDSWHGMSVRVGAEIAFTDARGSHWVRRANGKLEELAAGAVEHYRLGRPIDFVDPKSADLIR